MIHCEGLDGWWKSAVFWGAEEVTYDTLARQATAVAAHLLREEKIQPGERVAVWMKNCPEFIPAWFGIILAGGVSCP